MEDKNRITMNGRATLKAAAKGGNPRVSILAYTGGEMMVDMSSSPIVVDLKDLKANAEIPLLFNHNHDVIVGYGQASVKAGKVYVEGHIVPGSEAADRLIQLGRNGFPLQASIGGNPARLSHVPEGDIIEANGRRFKSTRGGLAVASGFDLREVSIVPIGADGGTSTTITAKGISHMEVDTNGNPIESSYSNGPLTGAAPSGITGAPRTGAGGDTTADVKAERERQIGIMRVTAGKFPELEAKAIREGWDLQKTDLEVLRASRPTGPAIHSHSSTEYSSKDHLTAGLLLRAGQTKTAEKAFGANVCQQADRLRGYSMMEFCRAALSAEGIMVPNGRNEMIRAAFSTLSLPQALGDSMGKSLTQAYVDYPATWRSWCDVKNVDDFRSHNAIRPSFTGAMEIISNGGEVKHVGMDEEGFDYQVGTYGGQFHVTRQTVINDDLGFLNSQPMMMANACGRKLSDLVYAGLLDNAGNFFHANNANYIEGATTNLGTDGVGLNQGLVKMRNQTDENGAAIDMVPRTLLVPPILENAAKILLQSEGMGVGSTSNASGNPYKNVVALEIEPRLNNTTYTGYSPTAWFLFASPVWMPAIVAYLNGQQTPTVEFFGLDQDINTLGMAWRVYHDFGFALADPRAALKSKGAT